MVRHGVVGQAEKHTVELLWRVELGGIALRQADIVPAMPITQHVGPVQHAGGQINAVDPARPPDRFVKIGKIPPGPASHYEDAMTKPKGEPIDRFLTQTARKE